MRNAPDAPSGALRVIVGCPAVVQGALEPNDESKPGVRTAADAAMLAAKATTP